MTDYVLEILDGDRAGETFALTDEPLTLGRRPGNTIVLPDEKCSGRHATVLREGGQWVLRDADSTNGTLLDGRRVQEVGLTANDIFQVGITRVAFKEQGAPTPRNDMSVRKLDSETLARTRRGGGVGILVVLVLLLGGGAAWFLFFRGGKTGPVGARARPPLQIAGNRLTGADFEGDLAATFQTVSGVEFTAEGGRAGSHSGTGHAQAPGDPTGKLHHAVLRSTADVLAASGSGVRGTAWLRTSGNARAAVRLRFFPSNDAPGQVMFTGSVPAAQPDYAEVGVDAVVPDGCDRVALEIVAFLPDAESGVQVDDAAVLEAGATSDGQRIQTGTGQRVVRCGASLRMDDGVHGILTNLRPLTKDPILLALAKDDLLCPSDAGCKLTVATVAAEPGQVTCTVEGVDGVVLRLAPGIAASGVLAAKGDAPFTNVGARFEATDVDSLLLGSKTSRVLVQLPAAAAALGVDSERSFDLTLPRSASFRLVCDFGAHRAKARELLEEAQRADGEGDYKQELDKLQLLLDSHPHDDGLLARALTMRSQVRERLADRVRRIETELDGAFYFGSLRGFRRLREELQALVRTFGADHLTQPARIEQMNKRVADAIAGIEREAGAETRGKLDVLAGVYRRSDNEQMAALIQEYIDKHLPAKEPAPEKGAAGEPPGAGGAPRKKEGN